MSRLHVIQDLKRSHNSRSQNIQVLQNVNRLSFVLFRFIQSVGWTLQTRGYFFPYFKLEKEILISNASSFVLLKMCNTYLSIVVHQMCNTKDYKISTDTPISDKIPTSLYSVLTTIIMLICLQLGVSLYCEVHGFSKTSMETIQSSWSMMDHFSWICYDIFH